MRTDIDMGYVCISGQPGSFLQSHASVTDESKKPPVLIIHGHTLTLDASYGIQRYWLAFLWYFIGHEDAGKGIPSINAMLCHRQIDDGLNRPKHPFDGGDC